MKEIKKDSQITRRKFINLTAQGGAGLSLIHSLPFISSCNEASAQSFHGACYHDCPDTCSWTVKTEGNKVVSFQPNAKNPYTGNQLCSKMDNFPNDVTFHPDRVLRPLKRTGKKGSGQFEPINWDQAIAEVAQKVTAIIKEKGGEAVMPYSFAGTEGLVQRSAISDRFFAHIGATGLERNICGDAAVAGVMATNGQTTGVLPEDIVHSRYILLWGTNSITSNQHLWPYIIKAKAAGAKVVVVDPFRSHTAAEADWHVQPMPGTDTVLALGLIHVILKENLQDQQYIDQYTVGIDTLRTHVEQYSPEVVADITKLEEATIIKLAREYATASPSLIRILIGMEHHTSGGSAFRAIAMLPAITGAWKEMGGGLMHMTYELFGKALNWEQVALGETLAKDVRKVNMIQIGRALTDANFNPGIHALFVYNSNPAVIAPNQNQVIKGLEREDLLTVVLEHFITDTARYADYVFPATSQLEHWDLMTSWGQTYININQPAIAPLGEAKPNTEFFRLLSRAMGFTESYLYESDLSIVEKTLDSDDELLKGITFESLKKTGWARLNLPDKWMPHAEGNFKTPSGKCEFFNASLSPAVPTYSPRIYTEQELADYPLVLLSIKSTKYFLNSSHANVEHLQTKEGKPYLDIHEDDAKARGLSNNSKVIVSNQNGEVTLQVHISNRVKKGVVCMPQGYWMKAMEGGSTANALTDDRLTDMGDGAALQGVRVEVKAI